MTTHCSSCLLRNLYVDPVGILDVQTGIVESGDPDCKVVHDAGSASIVERDEHLGVTEADYAAGLILTDHRGAEHLLIEIDGPLQVRDMNADMVDVRVFEIEAVLGSGGRSAGGQRRQAANQFSTAERALLDARDEMRNDGFDDDFLSLKVGRAARL
jgi:hypothetical protein